MQTPGGQPGVAREDQVADDDLARAAATDKETILSAALTYRARGLAVTPVQGKKPVLMGWPQRRLTEAELPTQFRDDVNIGVVNGEMSGGLVDVDLDAPEALAGAD